MDTKENAFALLHRLLDRNTVMQIDGFSVDIAQETEIWDRCIKQLGIHEACRRMAEYLCAAYERRFAEPFLFSERCVAYELEYHVDAFMTVQGYAGYGRNVTTLLFTKAELKRHCELVDISVRDVASFRQRLMFRYRKGIRACYRRTERDPFCKRSKRRGRTVSEETF